MYAFQADANRWRRVNHGQKPPPSIVGDLRVATYNVWFDPLESARRCGAVLDILELEQPDIIALQEVTASFLAALLEAPWVRESYQVSQHKLSPGRHYDVVMLSRLPVHRAVLHPLPSTMGRRLHMLELRTNRGSLAVAGVHLESMRNMTSTRLQQIERAISLLSSADAAIWLGDFNAAPDSSEDALIRTAFSDAWSCLSNDAGYTRDTTRNAMLAKVKTDRHQRIDRVLTRGGWLVPKSLRLLGTEPLSGSEGQVFPSDHFGLIGELALPQAQASSAGQA